tara:strand:+ start:836 stop:1348 length:513 start_codon:yes stop_codon:yes gene_type:complete
VSNSSVRYIVIIVGVLFFQLIVLNRLNISQNILPLIYPIILLTLVRNINGSLLLLIGFILGYVMDVFSNTGGAHAVACTVLAFLRPFFLSSIGPMDMGSDQIQPSIISFGIKNFAVYSFFLLAIHHVVFFLLEVFSFNNFPNTLLRIISSLLFSWVLIMALQFLFNGRKR